MRCTIVCLFCLLMVYATGCAHKPLRRNVLRQAQTLTDVYEQQVLDNIAMAIAAPDSTPFFAIPKGGSTQVTQTGGTNVDLNWNPFTLISERLNLSGSGSLSENWALEPVSNPDRLELMSCLISHVTCKPTDECQDCSSKLSVFFGGDYPQCLPTCFFGHGKKADVPHSCVKSGRYEKTHVWVTHEHYANLRATTLAILDIITADLSAFDPPKANKISVTQRFKKGQIEYEADLSLTPEEYKELIEGSGQVNVYSGNTSESAPTLNEMLQPRPMFRSRIEERSGTFESLLLLPRN